MGSGRTSPACGVLEGVDTIAALLNLILVAHRIRIECNAVGLWSLILNLPINVYIVMLQRRNRGRMLPLLRRIHQLAES